MWCILRLAAVSLEKYSGFTIAYWKNHHINQKVAHCCPATLPHRRHRTSCAFSKPKITFRWGIITSFAAGGFALP
jgi:hypothetical protein